MSRTDWQLTPHEGDFGMSTWVRCEAPQCLHEGEGAGWFAIVAGQRCFYDPQRHQFTHRDCGEALLHQHQQGAA